MRRELSSLLSQYLLIADEQAPWPELPSFSPLTTAETLYYAAGSQDWS